MKNKKTNIKNKQLIIFIITLVLLVFIVGATFAYYIGRSSVSNILDVATRIQNNNGTFIAQGANIELNITRDLMSQSISDDENAIIENNSILNIEYLSGTDERIICSYDIMYEWISDNNENPYSITNNEKKEFTYQIYDVSGIPIIPNEETNSEVNFVSSSDRNAHNLKTLYISNASKIEPTYQNYKIDAKFYNLSDDQTSNAGKNWNIRFYVDNVICGIKSEIVYETLSGNGAEVVKGDNEELDTRIDANYNKFTSGSSVYVDANFVDPSNYTSESGSTIVRLKPEYVENLSVGNHLLKIIFNDGGVAEVTFRVSPVTVSIAEPITNETYIGRTLNLTANTNSKNQTVEWISDDTSIATVDSNGNVTGVSVGKAKIKAKIGSIESEEIEVNVKTNIYDVNITDKNTNNETLGIRTDTCTILENKTIEGTTYEGYTSPNNETIICQETNNITLTYSANEYDITVTDTSSNGQLGTRTEKCTYGESTLVPVGSYEGYASPIAETITCGVTNTKTYTYTPSEYVVTVTDKTTGGETLGTRNIACTYGVNTEVSAGTYTGYTSPASTSTVCGLSNSATNNLEMTYTSKTYDVTITDVSSNGSTLGTRTESCTYNESYTPTVTNYTGHTSPSTSAITCGTSNSKTYTYEANEYSVTIADKNKKGDVLGTRNDTCIYGTSYTASGTTYTEYNTPTNIEAITCGASNEVNLVYEGKEYQVSITNVSSSGISLGTSSETCIYNESKVISPSSKTGYTSPNSQTFTCDVTNNKTFTYTPTSYTITYTLNSGSASNPSSYTIETDTFTLNNPTRSYYNFTGWSGTDLAGSSNTSVSIAKGSTGNRSYTANFEANYYNVSYNANNGSGAPSAQNNITWNTNVTLSSTVPTRSNYDFLGWSTSNSATSASYSKGGSYNLSSLTSRGGTVTLYAVWKKKASTVYLYNGGSINSLAGDFTISKGSSSYSGGTFSKKSSYLSYERSNSSNQWSDGGFMSTKAVNVTDYNTLTFVFNSSSYIESSNSSSYPCESILKIGLSPNAPSTSMSSADVSTANTTIKTPGKVSSKLSLSTHTVDISSISGSYYVGLFTTPGYYYGQTWKLYVTQIYLS